MAIMLRLPGEIHDLARIAAAARRRSLNTWICAAVRAQILREAWRDRGGPLAAALNQTAPAGSLPAAPPDRRRRRMS